VAVARQVRDQDADLTGPAPSLRRGVAKDRRISVEDGQMRHGRKSRSVLFDGYKRHVLQDLDTAWSRPWASPRPARRRRASPATSPPTWTPPGCAWPSCNIDRAYLASGLVRDRGPDLAVFCKAWRVRNHGGRFGQGPVHP